jgi:hypothetical protein
VGGGRQCPLTLLLALAGTTAVAVTAAPAATAGALASESGVTVSTAGLQPGDALTSHNFRLRMDGAPVEHIAEVSGLQGRLRGARHLFLDPGR